MFEWITTNAKSLVGGITVLTAAIGLIKKFFVDKNTPNIEAKQLAPNTTNTSSNTNSNSLIVNLNTENKSNADKANRKEEDELSKLKNNTKILFIDDDSKFKVVSIMKKAGWIHTKATKDIESTDSDEAKEAHIFFVDIQGVGISMGFKDEGLGLALALKRKYPLKKVIIYSSEQNGERFHAAFNEADYLLAKNADPYEFQNLVETFSREIANT